MKRSILALVMMTMSCGAMASGSTVALSCPTYGDVVFSMDNGYSTITAGKKNYPFSKGTVRFSNEGEIVTVQMAAKNASDNKYEQMAAVLIKVSDALKGHMAVMLPGQHIEECKITDRQSY